jgi:hypothetical protein
MIWNETASVNVNCGPPLSARNGWPFSSNSTVMVSNQRQGVLIYPVLRSPAEIPAIERRSGGTASASPAR